jgi:inosine-uridine nucleoside N-ribohydrolase
MNHRPEGFVFRGSTEYLTGRAVPEPSPAALDLVERAMASPEDNPLYVVAIGAITNVASAILIEPEIIRRIVVVWLGGNPVQIPRTLEFNLMQDCCASQLMFESGLPLVHIPCLGVASHLLTTKTELEDAIVGRNPVSDFLYQRFCEYASDHFAWAKEIWDISTIAYLINPDWVPTQLIPSPVLSDDFQYLPVPSGRHAIRAAWFLNRNPIFHDLFTRLRAL